MEKKSSPVKVRRRNAITRILVPVDFSGSSMHAVRMAKEIAGALGAEITLLHVAEPLHVDWRFETTSIQKEQHNDVRKQLDALLAKELADVPKARAQMAFGHAVTAITDFAKKARKDLIVIGTHGRTGLSHMLLGSVAERVVRHAPCAVLVAR
jgi:universal stress protein A